MASAVMRRCSMTKKQLSVLLDYMENHEDLCIGTITLEFTRSHKNCHWIELSQRLNAVVDPNKESGRKKKSAAIWRRTWFDWRRSVKKKAREIQNQKECGLPTKTLSPLEVRALKLFSKLDSGKFQLESDLKDQELPEEENIENETASIEPVRLEDVLYISDNSNASSCEELPSGTSIASPRLAESSSITSSSAVPIVIEASVKDNVPASSVANSVYVVSTKAVPPLAAKKASKVVNTAVVSPQKPSKRSRTFDPLLVKTKQDSIQEIDLSGDATIPESSATHSTAVNLDEDPANEDMVNLESSEDEFETSSPLPSERRKEDPLGALPLSLQNSIMERLDTLNRNIETNTCALTILAKAVNDSAEMNTRAVNHLAKSLNKIGNMVGSYMEFMKNQ